MGDETTRFARRGRSAQERRRVLIALVAAVLILAAVIVGAMLGRGSSDTLPGAPATALRSMPEGTPVIGPPPAPPATDERAAAGPATSAPAITGTAATTTAGAGTASPLVPSAPAGTSTTTAGPPPAPAPSTPPPPAPPRPSTTPPIGAPPAGDASRPESAAHALSSINAYRARMGMPALRDKASFGSCNEYYTLTRSAISPTTYASQAQIDQNMDVVLWGESFNGFSWTTYQQGGSWGGTMTLYQCR